MRHTGRFVFALILGVGLAVGAVAGTIMHRDRGALSVNELLLVEPAPTGEPLDDALQYTLELFDGTRQFTEAGLERRFTPTWVDLYTAEDLNAQTDELIANAGMIRFVRVLEREPLALRALLASQREGPGEALVQIDEGGLIAGLDLLTPPVPPRIPIWESTLMLLAGVGFLVSAGAAWRSGANREAWALLAGSVPTLAGTLALSDTGALYTLGRISPNLLAVFAAVLLVRSMAARTNQLLVMMAVAASVVGVLAVFVRNPTLVGHPEIVGLLTDDADLYKILLISTHGLTVLAMGGVAALNVQRATWAKSQRAPALWAAAVVAALWALAAMGSAVDLSVGDGALAGGSFRAVALAAFAVVPTVVILDLVFTRWDRPELATLVIDLEADTSDLQPAISKALDDPTLQVLTSPDGELLVQSDGESVDVLDLPKNQAFTRIQSGDRLVGGLIHDAKLQRDSTRLEAVAAAAGMALEVSRLNRQIAAHLDEVDASRTRILNASDTARRRVERDLHDGAQQRLVALGLRLQRARRLATAGGKNDLADLLEEATAETRDAIDEIRAVSRGGQPALLAERGLGPAIDALAERTPVPVHIAVADHQLPPRTETTAYYLIAEGLTNIAKHALATNARVSVTQQNGKAHVSISDNGKGGAEIAPGSGLEGLGDRIAAAGGTFTIASGPEGTTLEATIPCE